MYVVECADGFWRARHRLSNVASKPITRAGSLSTSPTSKLLLKKPSLASLTEGISTLRKKAEMAHIKEHGNDITCLIFIDLPQDVIST